MRVSLIKVLQDDPNESTQVLHLRVILIKVLRFRVILVRVLWFKVILIKVLQFKMIWFWVIQLKMIKLRVSQYHHFSVYIIFLYFTHDLVEHFESL